MESQGAGTQPEEPSQPESATLKDEIPDHVKKEKRADKPHHITILLGVLSPGLALMALFLSLYSCRQSERAVEISQRAYVAVKGGNVRLSWMKIGPPQVAGETRPLEPIIFMTLSVNLENAGNTPAQFVSFTPNLRLPEGWTLLQGEWMPKIKVPGELGPKSQEVWLYRQSFELTPAAWELVNDKGRMTFLSLNGELMYKDVFDQQHAMNWCWSMPASDRYEGPVNECIILERRQ